MSPTGRWWLGIQWYGLGLYVRRLLDWKHVRNSTSTAIATATATAADAADAESTALANKM
jgi:hypothetical protein